MANDKKTAQLGIPFGTASNKLRKNILFNVLKRHGENICFRCNREIATERELSIEHIKPWLDVDPALFWDITNIAFSHLSCNSRHGALGNTNKLGISPPNKKTVEPGTKWCVNCREAHPVRAFGRSRSRRDGLDAVCLSSRAIARTG